MKTQLPIIAKIAIVMPTSSQYMTYLHMYPKNMPDKGTDIPSNIIYKEPYKTFCLPTKNSCPYTYPTIWRPEQPIPATKTIVIVKVTELLKAMMI